jgi:ATP phosphoribosyltransferase
LSRFTPRCRYAIHTPYRIHANTTSRLDIQFHRHNRLDIALVKNHPLALIFLPAADIPRFVAEGNVHLGITGQDQVAEFRYSAEEGHGEIHEVLELGFGKCKLQVQVPENGNIQQAEGLIGKRVVTSFVGLARKYFADLEAKGKSASGDVSSQTQIKYVGGSVEAACALGVADGIVDLVGMPVYCAF